MSRALLLLLFIVTLTAVMASNQAAVGAGAVATPGPANHLLVGTGIVRELAPPTGGPPVIAGVATFFADGNLLLSGFGDGQASMQGAWSPDDNRAGTVTVVGLLTNGTEVSGGTMSRIRAAVELNATGSELEDGYTLDVIGPDGGGQFTYNGPLEGTRVEIEPPDPIALTVRPATPSTGAPAP
jgi:hypothetical protein